MEIRIMSKEDIPEAIKIERLSFSVPWTEGMFLSELENPRCRYYAILENEKLLGFAGMLSVIDEGCVNNIAVTPEARCRGIGSMLMKALIDYSRSISLSYLTLEVRESNRRAISLYSRLGFVEAGRRLGYYERPKEDAVLMTLSINT